MDLDFFFRATPSNLRKIRRIADDLDGVVLRPYCPASALLRLTRDGDALQFDFMSSISGVRSYEGVRARASEVRFGKGVLRVAALSDIIRSKEVANRPKDRAVLEVLKRTVRESEAMYEAKPKRRRR